MLSTIAKSQPADRICASSACTLGASGVVTCSPVSCSTPAMRAPTVVMTPTAAERLRMASNIEQVVVLPSVPVTPITAWARLGKR